MEELDPGHNDPDEYAEEDFSPEPEICPSCNGAGSWEYWGRLESCSSCRGKGSISLYMESE